uniref:Uncharacterized protein n=1 Tax=Rhinopithecus roxellana TaxID=61622 RepID=A0A2K6QZP5_RHIRO
KVTLNLRSFLDLEFYMLWSHWKYFENYSSYSTAANVKEYIYVFMVCDY